MQSGRQKVYNFLIAFILICQVTAGSLESLGTSKVTEVEPAKYPWVVSVRVDHLHVCVGTIISNRHILTAGSCLSASESTPINVKRVTSRVGSVNQFAAGSIIDTESITIHSRYGNFMNNLAIIELSETLNFTKKIDKIDLADENYILNKDSEVLMTGWSLDINDPLTYQLKELTVSVVTSEECEEQTGYGYEKVICLKHPKGNGVCRGDHGSGIVHGTTLVGVASFAFGACGTEFPDISTRISSYRDWIDSVII